MKGTVAPRVMKTGASGLRPWIARGSTAPATVSSTTVILDRSSVWPASAAGGWSARLDCAAALPALPLSARAYGLLPFPKVAIRASSSELSVRPPTPPLGTRASRAATEKLATAEVVASPVEASEMTGPAAPPPLFEVSSAPASDR